MNLLFDNNLSRHLVSRLADVVPHATHVADLGLERATDQEVWDMARAMDATIVTKDSDFNDLLVWNGPPPKVVWLRIGNCTTREVEVLLRANVPHIERFVDESPDGLLTLV